MVFDQVGVGASRLLCLSLGMVHVPDGPGTVMFVESDELGEVDLSEPWTLRNLQQVLVIVIGGVVAHVIRSGVNDRMAGFGVNEHEFVVNVYRWRCALFCVRRWRHNTLAGQIHAVELGQETSRCGAWPEVVIREHLLVFARAFIKGDLHLCGCRGLRGWLA